MADLPYRVEKPWGYEIIWAHTGRYVGKVLHVRAGQALSCQYHNVKDETLYVLTGELRMTLEPPGGPVERRVVRAGEAIHLPPKTIHEMEAVVDSDVLEASTPELDDIVRLKDRYGRA
ncbi:MAG: cupin domain-containing protein [Gemmatimonadetes bacterium]|nr:cupin domain-containing protein [Gemmatimonadota bacterium]